MGDPLEVIKFWFDSDLDNLGSVFPLS